MSQSSVDPQLSLRPLKAEDIVAVALIEKQVYSDPWTLELLSESLKAPMTYTLGIFKDDQVLAYSIYQLIFSEGHLLNIAVHPELQGQKLGAFLLDEILSRAIKQGATTFFLEVRPSNEVARKLYEKRGFRELMVRERYYGNGESAIVMIKDLT